MTQEDIDAVSVEITRRLIATMFERLTDGQRESEAKLAFQKGLSYLESTRQIARAVLEAHIQRT